MSIVLTIIFCLQCIVLSFWGLTRKGRITQMPFLVSCVLIGFVLPQLVGLLEDKTLPPDGLDRTLIIINLSTFAFSYGYFTCKIPMRSLNFRFSGDALTKYGLFLVAAGSLFYYLISRLPEEQTSASQWTGLPVAYTFMAQAMTYGFAILLLIWGEYRSKLCLLGCSVATLFYLDRIIIAGRRGSASEFFLVILCGLWFSRRYCPPRAFMIFFAVVAILLVNSVGQIRHATLDGSAYGSIFQGKTPIPAEALANINYIENLKETTETGGVELRNAVFEISAVSRTASYDLGAFQWNELISRYLPAQIFGRQFKNSFLIQNSDNSYSSFGYERRPGSTLTGFTDAYRSFWFLGCLSFLIIGRIMAKFYWSALNGHFICRLFYMVLATKVLLSITHGTDWFYMSWPHICIFLFPGLLLCKIKPIPFPMNQPASDKVAQ